MSEPVSYLPAVRTTPPTPAARDVVDGWAAQLAPVIELTKWIADSEFVPDGLRNHHAAIAAAILSGREIGIGPMAALQHVRIIKGTPALSAHMARALVLAAGHQIVYDETTTARCVVRGRRFGQDTWTTVTWTLDDARAMGINGKDNWKRMPRQMLVARATSELCRLIAADALQGVPYTAEELDDDTGVLPAAPDTTIRRTVRRTPTPQPPSAEQAPTPTAPADGPDPAPTHPPSAPGPDQPPLPGETGYDDPEPAPRPVETVTPVDDYQPDQPAEEEQPRDTTDWAITKPQLTKLWILLRDDFGLDDPDLARQLLAGILGHQVDSTKLLTRGEARTIIDTLERINRIPELKAHLAAIPMADQPAQEMADLLGRIGGNANEQEDPQ